jgi:hypothetical protein
MLGRNRKELHDLLASIIDGQPTAEQQTRLNELLRDDPAAQDLYLIYSALHAELALSADEGQSLSADPQRYGQTAYSSNSRWGWAWTAVGIAATAAAVLFLVSSLAPSSPPVVTTAAAPVATLVEFSADAEWSQSDLSRVLGASLAAGLVELLQGRVTLRMQSGAEVILEAPARAELVNGMLVRLERGRTSVRVPEQAIGFRVLTPTAEIVDMGTEFGVAVEADGASEVHVFHGLVMARRQGSDLIVPLLQDEAGRIEAERGDLMSIESDPERFPRLPVATTNSVPAAEQPTETTPLAGDARIVFLGETETDCETFVLLTAQALNKALLVRAPRVFNSGESLPLKFDEQEFLDNVARLRPTHAVLAFASRIALNARRFPPAEFEAHLVKLIERLRRDQIEPILVTGTPVDSAPDAAREHLDAYNEIMRRLAAERGLRFADAERRFRRSAESDLALLNHNDFMPTFAGCRELAATVLEAMGYAHVPVPTTLQLSLLPGTVTHWKVRGKAADERLDDAAAARLAPDAGWRNVVIPQRDKLSSRLPNPMHSLTYQMRERGFGMYVPRHGSLVEGVAQIESDRKKSGWINLGGEVRAVWLNGKSIYVHDRHVGRHAGKVRIPVELQIGRNQIVIESYSMFFVSVTDKPDWTVCGRVTGDEGAGQ